MQPWGDPLQRHGPSHSLLRGWMSLRENISVSRVWDFYSVRVDRRYPLTQPRSSRRPMNANLKIAPRISNTKLFRDPTRPRSSSSFSLLSIVQSDPVSCIVFCRRKETWIFLRGFEMLQRKLSYYHPFQSSHCPKTERREGPGKGHCKLSIPRSRSINPIRGPQEVRLIEISRGPLTSNRCQTQPETRRKEGWFTRRGIHRIRDISSRTNY